MRRKSRVLGVGLIWLALLAPCIELVRRASGIGGDEFNRYVGWANILALVVGAAGLAFVVADRILVARSEVSPDLLNAAEDDIAHALLRHEAAERSRLLGTNKPEFHAIDLEYYQHLIRYRTAGGADSGTLQTVLGYYDDLSPRRMLILGSPGSGKTVLATHLTVQLLERRVAGYAASEPIPLRVTLADYDPKHSLEDWITRELISRFPHLNWNVAHALVSRRRILPVLDGLDEMDGEHGAPGRGNEAVNKINRYMQGSALAPVVVTSRANTYERLNNKIDNATTVEIQPLNTSQILTYLYAQFSDPTDELAWLDIVTPLREAPDSKSSREICDALSTPWVLVMSVAAYRDGEDPRGLTPDGKKHYARRLKEMLLSRFVEAITRLYSMTSPQQYDGEEVMRWLRTISQRLATPDGQDTAGGTIMLHSWWMFIGPKRVRRSHATAAFLITMVAALTAVFSVPEPPGSSTIATVVRVFQSSSVEGPYALACVVVLCGLVILPCLAALAAWTTRIEPSRANVGGVLTKAGLKRLLLCILAGVIAGVIVGFNLGLAEGLAIGLELGLMTGSMAGLLAGISFGLIFASNTDGTDSTSPIGIIRSDLAYGLVTGLSLGAIALTATSIIANFYFGTAVGVSVFAILGVATGPRSAVRYFIAVLFGRYSLGLPLRFGKFLRWATAAGLLRTAGVGYQFRHRELQEWLKQSKPH